MSHTETAPVGREPADFDVLSSDRPADGFAPTAELDVLVIGGGQAGLAMGYHLAERDLSHLIVDAHPSVGQAWRSRWESLRLFTASQYSGLPGALFPASRDAYPSKEDVADFLEDYAAKFDLPVRLNTSVVRLTRTSEGYSAETTTGPISARQVVVATGPFQVPFTPAISTGLDPQLTQLHSASYHTPADLPEGRVLVVGAANSGQQIALELAGSREVDIAVGQKLPTLPQRALGRDVWWWLTSTGVASVPVSSRMGQRLSQRDVVIGGGLKGLRRSGVGIRPRVVGAEGRTLTFEGGESADYEAVVWATGFRTDHSWIEIPEIKDEHGQLRHVRGVAEGPGLYLLGTTWQHTRTSALLGWVGDDAGFLADHIEATFASPASTQSLAATPS